MAEVVLIEPYYGGSHKQLVDVVVNGLLGSTVFNLITLPAKKWHWRARTSALYFSSTIQQNHNFKVLFASSVLNLAELVALRPDLAQLKKVLYFHENQLVYPVRKRQERDFQFGYNQVLSCLVADEVVFNSAFNMNSFLDGIPAFFKMQPDYRPKNLSEDIKPKCRVLYFPIEMPCKSLQPVRSIIRSDAVLHICWPHRWEHDKGPDIFFRVLSVLVDRGAKFKLSVLGQQYSEVPEVFIEFKGKMESFKNQCEILNWGYVPRENFIHILSTAHVVVSTALHEFFGVSMLEAASLGCFPLCPDKLSYPEIFPADCLYRTEKQLVKKLLYFCKRPSAYRSLHLNLDKFSWDFLKSQYADLFVTK